MFGFTVDQLMNYSAVAAIVVIALSYVPRSLISRAVGVLRSKPANVPSPDATNDAPAAIAKLLDVIYMCREHNDDETADELSDMLASVERACSRRISK